MTRLVLISIFVALTVNIISVECSNDAPSTNIELTVVQNLTDYLRANPDVKLLHPMIKEPLTAGPSPRTKLIYKTGNRVNGIKKGNLTILILDKSEKHPLLFYFLFIRRRSSSN